MEQDAKMKPDTEVPNGITTPPKTLVNKVKEYFLDRAMVSDIWEKVYEFSGVFHDVGFPYFYTQICLEGNEYQDEWSQDMAPMYSNTDGTRNIFSVLTPWGVKRTDSYFIQAIYSSDTEEEFNWVVRQICNCHHLHYGVRRNLYFNLKRFAKSKNISPYLWGDSSDYMGD